MNPGGADHLGLHAELPLEQADDLYPDPARSEFGKQIRERALCPTCSETVEQIHDLDGDPLRVGHTG
jgi:hypothetical protein